VYGNGRILGNWTVGGNNLSRIKHTYYPLEDDIVYGQGVVLKVL